jgi:hypothetical protein
MTSSPVVAAYSDRAHASQEADAPEIVVQVFAAE